MRTFKDSAQREWTLSLTLGAEQRVHAATEVWLSDTAMDNFDPLIRFDRDGGFLLEVLWTLVKRQAEPLDKEGFADLLDAKTRPAAVEALTEETLDFLGDRGVQMRTLISHSEKATAETLQKRLDELSESPPGTTTDSPGA